MVDKIYEVKNQILERIQKEIQERGGVEHIDVQEMGMMVDMVKDLASAEESCWEAEYYRSVTEAMDGNAGYNYMDYNNQPMGYSSGSRSQQSGGSRGGSSQSRSGWANQYGSGRSRGYNSMGYDNHLDALRMEMRNADPQEREQIIQQIRDMGIM